MPRYFLAQRKGFAPLRRAPVHTAPRCAVCARAPCLFSPLRKPLALACASPIKSLSVLYSPPNKKPAKAGFLFGAPRATAFEPNGKRIEICVFEWCRERGCTKTIQAEKLREQLQRSRSERKICQNLSKKAMSLYSLPFCYTRPIQPN